MYHRFPNKETLAATLFAAVTHEFEADLSERLRDARDAAATVEAYIDALLAFIEESPQESRYYTLFRFEDFERMAGLPDGLRAELRELNGRLTSAWRDLAARVARERPEATPDLLMALVLDTAMGYGRRWLDGQASASPTAFAPALKSAALRGLGLR